MNITPPILDDSSYQDLHDKLVKRIPVYNPEWTDHNPSDPGITLLELFAYLGEHVLHRLNQVPEATYVEYLNLLQIRRRPAEPARALLRFETELPTGRGINPGTRVSAGDIQFETGVDLKVWPVTAVAVIKAAAPLPAPDSDDYGQVTLALDSLDPADDAAPVGYEPRDLPNGDGKFPVDLSAAVDGMLWIAVLNNTDLDNQDLLAEMGDDIVLNIGFAPDETAPEIDDIEPCPGPGRAPVDGAVQWEVSTYQVIDEDEPRYRAVTLEGDETGGLRRQGIVRLRVQGMGNFAVVDDDMLGAGDLPPRLDEEQEPLVLFWLRAFRHDNRDFDSVRFIDVNVTDCQQAVTARPEYLGAGDGQPDQQVFVNHAPVLADSLQVDVEEAGGWRTWQQVDGFHTSRDDDRHYQLDAVTGAVRFGIKRVPQIGQRIRARRYRHGGGRAGNIFAGAIASVSGIDGVEVTNPMPASGGADEEALDEALRRMPEELRRRDRAVTPGDFCELALATPGADIGRAETLELFRPSTRETNAAGVVSVMVWPAVDAGEQEPAPSRTQLRQVCNWLDQRRLLTTEVYVIPPVYRKIAVAVGLKIRTGYGADGVRTWVETVLRQYLSPLPPFGPEGRGWPLGRPVHAAELEAAVLQVEGVEYLEGLGVAQYDAASASWIGGRVELALDEVPQLAEVTVVEGAPLTPGEAIEPASGGPFVPVPVVADEC